MKYECFIKAKMKNTVFLVFFGILVSKCAAQNSKCRIFVFAEELSKVDVLQMETA